MSAKKSASGFALVAILSAAFATLAPAPALGWESALYPSDWQPGYTDGQGRFLHDFSYAGYHNSEIPIPTIAGPILNAATTYGADPTGATDSTAAIQAAIDDAETSGGAVVHIPAGLYRCDGQLIIDGDGVVLRGDGPGNTRVYFTEADTTVTYNGHIRFQGNVNWGADIPLAQEGANRSFEVKVADASGLAIGQEIAVGWVITPEFTAEHGMTGIWTAFTNQWKPFFRRRIVDIATSATPDIVRLDAPLRYQAKLRDAPSIRPVTLDPFNHGYLKECGIEDMSVSNAVDPTVANGLNQVQCILFRDAEDCWVRNVRSFASPLPAANNYHLQSGGINIENCNRMTVADCRMEWAQNLGSGGNGYLFQVSRSNEILTRDCYAYRGRHNFIQNWDFGTTGCVWLRCTTDTDTSGAEYHHSLAMACLVDCCVIVGNRDWEGGNRQLESSGAGHTVTQSLFWNTTGQGTVRSWNYGWGYIIGTGSTVSAYTGPDIFLGKDIGTAPEDYKEGIGTAATLTPQCLFEDQLAKRLFNGTREWRRYE